MKAKPTDAEAFWSGTYRRHPIAILNHNAGWLVYLDHMLQPRLLVPYGRRCQDLVAAQDR